MIFAVALAAFLLQSPEFTKSEKAAAEAVRRAGGEVKWVTDEAGLVLSIDFREKVKSLDLGILVGLPRSYALRVIQGDVDRASIKHLKSLRQLGLLVLLGTGVDDAGMKVIGQLKELNKLDVSGDSISAKGLSYLTGLKKLRRLFLYNTKITDVKPLEALTWLDQLDLPKTVSNQALARLREKLSHTNVNLRD